MPRTLFLVAIGCLAAASTAPAQQPAATAPPAAQPNQPTQPAVHPQVPTAAQHDPFNLSPQEQAYIDQVLSTWEKKSDEIKNIYVEFSRERHTIVGPTGINGPPAVKEKGKLAYHQPDRGSFQITESREWKAAAQPLPQTNQLPQQPPQAQPAQGKFVLSEEPGEHWVCSGDKIFQYRHHDEQLVVTPIPKDMQGKEIVNGPLPFLFGAKADKLKNRFFMKLDKDTTRGNFIGIHARPKLRADAAEYSDIYVVLQNAAGKPFMPIGIRVVHPNRSWDEYVFELDDAQVNPTIAGWFSAMFQEPRTPLGWKRVVVPLRQAQQPQTAPK